MILGGFELHFETFWCPEAAQASPERFRVPLGARVVPTGAQGAKNWFVGPSLASQNDVILELFLYIFSLENASKQILIF